MNSVRCCHVIFGLLFLICLWSASLPAGQAPSQCIQCHTNLKKLIRLCWEVEKIKPRPGDSAETSGEG